MPIDNLKLLKRPTVVLVIDVGGSDVKIATSNRSDSITIRSDSKMTARQMVSDVLKALDGVAFDVVSIGYPGVVMHGRPVCEPRCLGSGWVGFDFRRAFRRPVRIVTDAAMQALGGYKSGRMLFLDLGTGLPAALIVDGEIESTSLADLPYKKGRTYEAYIGKTGLKRLGKKKWRRHVLNTLERLKTTLEVDDVLVGGGNAKRLRALPRGVRRSTSANARRGGVRLWQQAGAPARRAAGRRR